MLTLMLELGAWLLLLTGVLSIPGVFELHATMFVLLLTLMELFECYYGLLCRTASPVRMCFSFGE